MIAIDSARVARVRHAFTAAVVMLAACGGDKEPTGTVANGSVRGTVTDITGASMANVVVGLSGNGQNSRSTNSGADGAYTFTDVSPGTYTVAVTPPTGFAVVAPGAAFVTVAGGAQTNASAFVLSPVVVAPDTCVFTRPNFGVASAADRELFAYDINAPLNLKKTVETTNTLFEVSGISYDSPGGGSVTGILVEPVGRSGLRPGVVVLHPSGNPTAPLKGARIMQSYAQLLAINGAIVIAIDAPFVRRAEGGVLLLTEGDRDAQIQLMQDLQRAVDVLVATGKVDPARIGFEGYSYGGIMGALFVGIERRLKAAVLAAAMGGHVTGMTTPLNWPSLVNMSCATRNAWFRAMTPVEPIRFISNAAPTTLLFQMGKFDTNVLPADAQALYDAASQPKEARWYDSGHTLPPVALAERHDWWHLQIGIDARPGS